MPKGPKKLTGDAQKKKIHMTKRIAPFTNLWNSYLSNQNWWFLKIGDKYGLLLTVLIKISKRRLIKQHQN